jgi:Putative  PD-(D/E)XK family member, (DUF4420)
VAGQDNLLSVFWSLPIPEAASSSETFSAQAIEQSSPHRIGKDAESRPAILISTSDAEKRNAPYPVALEHISIRCNVLCLVTDADQAARRGRFIVIRCESHDFDLIEYFLRTMEVHIHSIGLAPSSSQVGSMVEKLIELFRALSQPSKHSVQGLWAELLIIAESSDPNLLLRSWHGEPGDRYDFSAGGQCVEVKSTSGQTRVHHFSLEQLNPSIGTIALVVSLVVERSADGVTVLDLIDRIRVRMCDDLNLLAHLHRNVTLTLASDWRQAASLRFDHRLAKESFRFFEVGSIPSVGWPTPQEVTEVKFKANLSRIPSCDISSLATKGGLFASIAQASPASV